MCYLTAVSDFLFVVPCHCEVAVTLHNAFVQAGVDSLKQMAQVAPSRGAQSRGASARIIRRSDSEELDRLMMEVRQENSVPPTLGPAAGSVRLVQEQLSKLKDDLDACLVDRCRSLCSPTR